MGSLTGPRAPLAGWGWDTAREQAFASLAADGFDAGRVLSTDRVTLAQTGAGPTEVIMQRRFRREAGGAADYPVVGDWLALHRPDPPAEVAVLRAILPRTGILTRSAVSAARPDAHVSAQVLAANVDVAFIVTAFGRDLNPRRLERYLVATWSGGVRPVIVVNKVDGVAEPGPVLASVEAVAAGAPVHAISARTGAGLDRLRDILAEGVTGCLLGSSGVGKSTITNTLLGTSRQEVQAVRGDDERGRHTTSSRVLIALPSGGLLIDTPGLRAVGPWQGATGVDQAFADVEALAATCHFHDCHHDAEPGCAVRQAIARGALAGERLEDYHKLRREMRSLQSRSDVRSAREASRRLGRLYRSAQDSVRWKAWRDD